MRDAINFIHSLLLRIKSVGSWLIDGLICYGELVQRNDHRDYW